MGLIQLQGIPLPETGTVESSVAMLAVAIAGANCVFTIVSEASPGCSESTLCAAK